MTTDQEQKQPTIEERVAAVEQPEYPAGLRLLPTLRHLERHYGKDELTAAIELWEDPKDGDAAIETYNAELEQYKEKVTAIRRS
jgi:hypothetical protein